MVLKHFYELLSYVMRGRQWQINLDHKNLIFLCISVGEPVERENKSNGVVGRKTCDV